MFLNESFEFIAMCLAWVSATTTYDDNGGLVGLDHVDQLAERTGGVDILDGQSTIEPFCCDLILDPLQSQIILQRGLKRRLQGSATTITAMLSLVLCG